MCAFKTVRRRSMGWVPTAALAAVLATAVTGVLFASGVAQHQTSGANAAGAEAAAAAVRAAPSRASHHRAFTTRPALVPAGHRAFAAEGEWRTLATSANGEPVVQGTQVRAGGTGEQAAVAWIHQSAVRFELHPGYSQPGGTWSQPDELPQGHRQGLVATWNGGFLMGDSLGGFYLDGKQYGSLNDGVAAEVFFRDGSMTVGVWGRDVSMSPNVVGVRQQRKLMVDGGRIAPDIDSLYTWGLTDGGATYVRRSGVGVTKDGDLVYAIGARMSPRSLAETLQAAGAVRAMQLDINLSWPSFMAYDASQNPADPRPYKWGDFPRSAERYYSPSARDFVAVYARAAGGSGGCIDGDGAQRGLPGGVAAAGMLAC